MLNPAAKSIDKRHTLRRSAIQEQICVVELAGDRSAMLLDVSELGIGVQSVEGPLPHSRTPVSFVLPGGDTMIRGEGQVAWSDNTGCMGIRFTSLAPEMKEQIRLWVGSDANPLCGDAAEEESAAEQDARERVAQLEARIMVSGWEQVQALNFLVDQVAAMTQAGGVAIAVEDGAGIVCQASSGIAPEVGVRINSRSGLSWECVRTGEVVHCVDTETDPRVDRLVCRQLNMRSAMLVPVKKDNRVTGLVEVFSSRAHAFSSNTVVLLRSVAEAVGELEERLPALENSPVAPPLDDAGKAASLESTPLTAAAPLTTQPVTPSAPVQPIASLPRPVPVADAKPVVAKPVPVEVPKLVRESAPVAATSAKPAVIQMPVSAPLADPAPAKSAGVAAAAAPALQQKPYPTVAPKAAETIVEKARETSKPASVSALPMEKPVTAAEESSVDDLFHLQDASARSGYPLKLGVGVAAAVVCAGLTFGGLYWAHSGSEAKVVAAQPAATTPPSAPPVVQPSGAKIPVGEPIGGGSITPAAPKPEVDKAKSSTESPKPQQTQTVEIAESAVPVRVATSRPDQPAPVAAAPLPIAPPNTAGVSGILSTSVVVPTLSRPRVSAGVTGGRQIHRVEPRYPSAARSIRLSGTVVLTAHVSKSGKVSKIDVVSGSPILVAAAVEAVRQWRYEPFLLDGQPIDNTVTVQVKFNQPQ